MTAVDTDALRGWIALAEEKVRSLAEESERIQAQLAEARRQLMLLYERLATETHTPVAISPDEMGIARSTRERVQADAETILREHGKPMRIQDLHMQFVRLGMPLPGRGTPTNIAAHIAASDRFSRKGRGMYGLAEWDRPSHPASPTPPAPSDGPDSAITDRAVGLPGRQAQSS